MSLTQQQRGALAIVLAALLITRFTLFPQSGIPARPFDFCISCGTYGNTNLILNALLFMPLGAALRWRGASVRLALAICLITTVSVEMLQLIVIPGRFAALGDILSNTTGGVLGWVLAANWSRIADPKPQQGLVLGSAQGAAMVASVLAGGWLFQSSPTDQPYYGQVAPALRERGAVDGVVSGTSLNDTELPDGLLAPPVTEAIRARLRDDEMILQAHLVLRNEKRRPVLIVRVADSQEEEIGLLGIDGSDAYFAVRTRATDFALFQPRVMLRGAFRCDSCADGITRKEMQVTGKRSGADFEVAVTGEGVARHESMTLSANMTWLALLPQFGDSRVTISAATVFWVMTQAFALGYWFALAARGQRSFALALSGVAAVGLITQVVLPPLLGTGRGTSVDWAALLAGAILGATLALHLRRTRETH